MIIDDATWIVALFAGGMAGLFWSARRYDVAVKRYKAQQAVTDDLQQRSQLQLDQTDEQQRRYVQILDRQEALLSRVETLASRFENRPPT